MDTKSWHCEVPNASSAHGSMSKEDSDSLPSISDDDDDRTCGKSSGEEDIQTLLCPPNTPQSTPQYGVSETSEREYWIEEDTEILADLDDTIPATDHGDDDQESQAVVWWVTLFLSLLQTLHSVSDGAIRWLMKFIYVLLKYCGRYSPHLEHVAESFPRSPLCSNVLWAKECKQALLHEIVGVSGNVKLYPYKVYCYQSIIQSLQRLLLRPGFVQLCESTRQMIADVGCLRDVNHGQVWKDFLQVDGKAFLSLPLTYAFVMNIDWFEPFEHITYAVGVIYLAFLPRSVRYKRESIILLGIIPGPAEPSLTINTYLSPLVTELLQLWDSVPFRVLGYTAQQDV